jgi:hypothetical protein
LINSVLSSLPLYFFFPSTKHRLRWWMKLLVYSAISYGVVGRRKGNFVGWAGRRCVCRKRKVAWGLRDLTGTTKPC